MKLNVILGAVLIALGILVLVYQGFTYTSEKNLFDLGPIEANSSIRKTVPLSPVFGGLVLMGGIILLFNGNKTCTKS
jgi:uncharacterized membrane protein